MRPFLLFGGSSRQRHQYAVQVARQNNWFFWELNRDNFENQLRKTSVTTNLTGNPNVIYMTNVEKLSEKKFAKLLKLADESPHRFILATSGVYRIPKTVKKELHLIRVGDIPPDKLFDTFTKLMSEPDRELVRSILAQDDVNVELMLYILKDNAWKAKDPAIFYAVESCLRYLHKVGKDYIVSMLAYLFPTARLPLSFSKDKHKVYKEETAILEKLRKKYRLPKYGALETFRVLKQILPRRPELASRVIQELKLNEKEQKFLGVEHEAGGLAQTEQKPVPSPSNLKKWF